MRISLDMDSILYNGQCNNNYEIELIEYFISYFNWDIGFGKKHNVETLNKIKNKYNLNYEEIVIIYMGKTYIVKYSEKTKKHGVVKGYKLVLNGDKSKERENKDEYFVIVNMNNIDDYLTNESLLNIPLHLKETDDMLISRDFLGRKSFSLELMLSHYVWRYFVFKQDGTEELVEDFNKILKDKYGLVFNIGMNNLYNQLELTANIQFLKDDKTVVTDIEILNDVLKELYILTMAHLIKYHVVFSLNHFDNRDVIIREIYIDKNNEFSNLNYSEKNIKLKR